MPLTLSTADAVLKEDYKPGIREQLNNTVMLLAQVEKNTDDVQGRYARLAPHIQRNSGVGARLEGGTLPTAGNQGYAEERVKLRSLYGRVQINGQVIKQMSTDRGAFIRAIKSEMDGLVRDLRRDVNRELWGTSDGVIATTGTTTASLTVTLATATTAVQLRQLEPGMVIDIGDTSANPTLITNGSARTIQSVDTTAKTLVLDTAGGVVTTSSSHRIYRSGAGGSGATFQAELTGLQSIVDSTGALFNIDPATVPSWSAGEFANGGTLRNISENLVASGQMQQSISSGEYINMLAGSDGVHRAYANLLTSLKRFPNTLELKGGFQGLEAAAGGVPVPLTWDRDAPSNQLYGLRTDNLIFFENSDWEWMDQDGAVLQRVIGKDAYEATLFKYAEMATDQRNSHFKIVDLNES